ncbi:MAG: pitrilysin family protein [Rhodospirillales bacterium]
MTTRFLLAAILFLCSWRADAGIFNPEIFSLDNGMQVVVVPNHRVPVVTHMVWYKVGSADEGPGESGIAHFLEHLMFKGTPTYPGASFSTIVAQNGGQQNAFTSYDYTAYFQTVARDRLELMMELEADRMTNLELSERDVATEREVVIEERRSRVENSPGARLREQLNAALYLNHPYRRPVIGWHHEIAGLDYDRIIAFYRKWYAPNNAILVVAGDITAEELKPLAEKYYGVIPRADTPPRDWLEEPPHQAARTIELRDPRVRQPSWQRTYMAPSYLYGASEHVDALQIMAEILGGGSTSRLYRALVIDGGLAVSAGAWYNPDSRGPGTFTVYASPAPGVSLDEVAAAVDAEIAALIADGVTEDERKRAVDGIGASVIFARDSLSTGARIIGSALAAGQSIDIVEDWTERIAAVTPEQILAATGAVFDERRSVTARLVPEAGQ